MAKQTSDYRASGTEPLGSDPESKKGSSAESPRAGGKAAGGTANLRETTTTKRAAFNSTPTSKANHWPSKVDSFTDDKV